MKSLFLESILSWAPAGYLLAFFGLIIGGDEVLFIFSFLTQDGFFNFWIMALVMYGGTFIGDYLWYRFGGVWPTDSLIGWWSAKLTGRFDEHLVRRPLRTIFVSKFVYGINHAMIFRAGSLRISEKQFLRADAIATFLWIVIVGGIGYFSSASFSSLKHLLRFTEFGLFIGLILFLLLERFLRYFLKKGL